MATLPDPEPPIDDLADGEAMAEDELIGILKDHEERAVGHYEDEIASAQANNLDRYYRRPYGDERAGRSQVVDGTVAITVDNALAAVLKPFVSADETVSFEPRGKEDEEQANQATEYINYILHQDNCGFLILHDWFKDALLQKLGVVKAYWEDRTRERIKRLDNLDPSQVETLMAEGVVVDGPFGPDELGLFICDVVRSEPDGRLCVENIPPEEYRISPLARPGRRPPYEAHITVKTRSELIEIGFDKEIVDSLPAASSEIVDQRSIARRKDEGFEALDRSGTAGDAVMVNDEYALIDYDGDGIAELRHVIRCEDVILLNEEAEYSPFARLCPSPMPHKIYGNCPADQVADEQRIATVLWRQTLDNLYLSNNPRPVIGLGAERDDGSTIDDILSDAPGALIRAKDAGQLTDFSVPFVADKSFPMLSYIEQQAEAATGISRRGQGMDPDVLSKAGQVTATQAAIMEDGRNSRAEMIARIFAETGVKDLFRLMLKLVVAHQPRARMIRLRNEWVEMDPRDWNADMDLNVSVGLGMGSKAEQITTAQSVLDTMERVGATPFASLIDKEKVYNGLKALFRAAGIKNVDDYLNEPEKDEQGNLVPDEPMPNPEQEKMQAQMQLEMMKSQMKVQADAQEAQRKAEETYAKIQIEQLKAQSRAELDKVRAEFEARLAEEKFAFEARLAEARQAHNENMAHREADRHDHEAAIRANRPGGDLDK